MNQADEEFAPAKVNLTLKVGRARADGYHPLQSLTVFADWGDRLTVEPADGLHLTITGPMAKHLDTPEANLVLKAAYALRAAAGQANLGARLVLDKHLPVAAGLGGGSADAAAALRLLSRIWDLDMSMRQLAEIGSVVGADVPACVHNRPLMMAGIGHEITPLLACPDLHGVIVNPRVPVKTGDVFTAYDKTQPKPLASVQPPALGQFEQVIAFLKTWPNDLQSSACDLHPEIKTCLGALQTLENIALVRMCGSGSSCLGLFETQAMARDGADILQNHYRDWLIRPVTLNGAL